MKSKQFLIVLFIVVVASMALGDIPETISYQGVLTDASGQPVADGGYKLTFTLYDAETEGASLWTESTDVFITDGIFNVILGSDTPLDLPFNEPYWLGIKIGDDPELIPRIELTSSAYSLNAKAVAGETNVFPSDGNVGIGTTEPESKFEVTGTVHSTSGGFKFPDGTVQSTAAGGEVGDGHSLDAADGDPTDALYVDNDGRVGIGTTSPQRNLHIARSDRVTLVLEDTGAPADQKKKFVNSDDGRLRLGKFDDAWTFTPQMVIDNEGNVGIGTDDPSHPLTVYSDELNSDPAIHGNHIAMETVNTYGTGVLGEGGRKGVEGYASKGPTGGSYYGIMGRVGGMGYDSGTTYGVYGESSVINCQTAYGVFGHTSGSGFLGTYAVYASGDLAYTGSLINASDAKFKQGIAPSKDGVSKLMRLKPREFEFSSQPGFTSMNFASGKHYGFVAQELEEVFPELVVNAVHPALENADGEQISEVIQYKGVKIVELIPILVQAIQEQQETIETLKAQVAQLMNE